MYNFHRSVNLRPYVCARAYVCVYFLFFRRSSDRIERRKKSMVSRCIRRSSRLSTVKQSEESIEAGERRGLVCFSPLGFGRRVVLFGCFLGVVVWVRHECARQKRGRNRVR